MSHTIKLNEHIYYLLIDKNLNHFTVTSLRDELLRCSSIYNDPLEARLFVYKQIRYLAKQNLLFRDDNRSPMRAIYSKTLFFKASDFIKKIRKCRVEYLHFKLQNNSQSSHFEGELNQAKKLHENEMLIVASEIKEYQRLMNKYPQNIEPILQFYEKGQIRLLSLKGKLVALKNIQGAK
jgi:hypothetical protein